MRVISGSARGTILHSIEDKKTRPTLDRVKESLFNILQNNIEDKIVLDLFAGSGAIGIEFLSRGAKKAYFCDKSKEAINMIKQNLNKTRLQEKAEILNEDYSQCLKNLKEINIKLDIVFLDPPYKENYSANAIKEISELELLKENGIIIVETDEKDRDEKRIEEMNIKYKIYDLRKYGRAYLLFLR